MSRILPEPRLSHHDANGKPFPGALCATYFSQTSNPAPVYKDSALQNAHTNPVVSDDLGRFPVMYGDAGIEYKFVLTDATGGNPRTIDPSSTFMLTQSEVGQALNEMTDSEIMAEVTPLNYAFAQPDLRRYSADIFVGDQTSAIENAIAAATAIGGPGYVRHPGGPITHASTITVPVGLTICGDDRNACEFVYTGTESGWKHINAGPSGYGKVRFENIKFSATNAANAGAAIELNTGGFGYYQIVNCWLYNQWKYGIILDGAEVAIVERNLIDLAGAPTAAIWIVNGPDRVSTQAAGFTNVITIRDNMLSMTGGIGILDDGGNHHLIEGNNFNEHSLAMRVAGCTSINIIANTFESHKATGTATVQFTNLTSSGVNVGQNTNAIIKGNSFFTDQASGNNLIFISQAYTITGITQAAKAVVTINTVSSAHPFILARQFGLPVTFQGVSGMTQINGLSGFIDPLGALGGSSGAWTVIVQIDTSAFTAYSSGGTLSHFHTGCQITENVFGWTVGRSAAMDVTSLANSFCGYNFDLAQSTGMAHYAGVHNDRSGNTLLPPQNGSLVNLGGINGPTWGDTRYPNVFGGGQQVGLLGSTISTKLKGTATFSAATTNAVSFGITLSGATYQVSLGQSATSTSPPWVTSKSATGFTINFSASFTGTVDWIVEQ